MKSFLIVAAAMGLTLAIMIGVILYAEGKAQEEERKAELARERQLEQENTEYNYGHNVSHNSIDGEGDL